MSTNSRSLGRTIGVAIRSMVIITLVLGPIYCLVITGVGQLIFHDKANGSMIENSQGAVVGSSLIGQSFSDSKGNPLPRYFQPRPSAAGDGYDGAASSGSNLGPENPDLIKAIKERKQQVATFNHVSQAQVPADAVTASGSGLDPDISPDYAAIQEARVAHARNVPVSTIKKLVQDNTHGRELGFLGDPTVNVLELNLALDKL
jgi:K+-transporting ATPase ATPase C chain